MIKIVDFGLVVLTWMVQLIVYPSFQYFAKEDLIKWHGPYTSAITIIVLPLMLSQLVLHVWSLKNQIISFDLIILFLVVATWVITFTKAVPLHQKIGEGVDLSNNIRMLLSVHWIRTILWTLIFLLGWLPWSKQIL